MPHPSCGSRALTATLSVAFAFTALGMPAPLLAQSSMLEEVIVTATKREVNMQDLPMSIEAFNTEKYGSPMPGRPYHGPSTFRPAEAEAIFREMLQPWIDSGRVQMLTRRYPVRAHVTDNRLLTSKGTRGASCAKNRRG